MVYDCFMFFDELDLLEIRMNILDPVVDYFVITEATSTLMGLPKKMYFDENRGRYKQFEKKIIYNAVDTLNMEFENQWQREIYQKNYCINGIKDSNKEDIIIFSDLDEIPRPESITSVKNDFDEETVYHLAQEMYYFFFNYKNIDGTLLAATGEFPDIIDKKWLGSKICSSSLAKKYGMDMLRHPEMLDHKSVRISNGGWHFSYMGGSNKKATKRIKDKLAAFSHEEYNKWRFYNPISVYTSIFLGKDLLGRKSKFRKVKFDDTYPRWLIENRFKYPHFIL